MNEDSNEKAIAFRTAQYIKEHLYPPECFAELRQLKTPTDKAVYQHIMFRGPSRYSHIRKALDLGNHGLSDSLKRMRKSDFIYITEANQYELTVRKGISKKLENLRVSYERLIQLLYGSSLAWGVSVSLDKNGLPLVHQPNIGEELKMFEQKKTRIGPKLWEAPIGPELRKIRDNFYRFLKENCERCEHGFFADENDLRARVPSQWCRVFDCEIQPKKFNPGLFADGCKYFEEKRGS